jgi:hypothetical protein
MNSIRQASITRVTRRALSTNAKKNVVLVDGVRIPFTLAGAVSELWIARRSYETTSISSLNFSVASCLLLRTFIRLFANFYLTAFCPNCCPLSALTAAAAALRLSSTYIFLVLQPTF